MKKFEKHEQQGRIKEPERLEELEALDESDELDEKLQRLLEQEKQRIADLDVPQEMEARLKEALAEAPQRTSRRKSPFSIRLKVAAAILLVFFFSYNLDTFAYYGKQLLGYENVMNGTLQQLNEMGKGQIINKSHTFQNGVKVILDGVMLDDNNLVLFYTIQDPAGHVMDVYQDLRVSLTGFAGRFFTFGGHGEANEDMTEMKWVLSTHEMPRFYEKTFHFKAELRQEELRQEPAENATISFKLNRNQAVGKSLKIPISRKIELDRRGIKLQSLIASPITTVLKGQIQDTLELGLDYITGNRFRPEKLEIALIADGKEIPLQGSNMSTDIGGINFSMTFDALPKDTKELELRLISFGGDHDVSKSVKLAKGQTDKFEVLGQEIRIEKVYESDGSTYITFTTEEGVVLSKVSLNIDGERKNLRETIPGDLVKTLDPDQEKAIIYYTRTMRFEGTGQELELNIERIRYTKDYNMLIWETSVPQS